MGHVRLSLTADGQEGEIHPVYDIWANAPYIERSWALQWNRAGETLGILHYAEGDVDAFSAAIEEIPEVIDADIERTGEDAFYVYLRDATTDALREMFGPLTAGGIVVIPPVFYGADGRVTLSLYAPDEQLQYALDRLPDAIDVSIKAVSGLGGSGLIADGTLTDRQREVLRTALAMGYYEIPRETDHEAVAEAMGVAPSTAAEHLRKAEQAVIRSAMGTGRDRVAGP